MSSPAGAVAVVSQRLDPFLSEQRAHAVLLGEEALVLVDAGLASARGGKGLRARFCLAGWRSVAEAAGASVEPSDDVAAAAAALELFHTGALVHDDLIDNSDTRRGRPAAHRALEQSHRGAKWRGDPEQFGRSAAVLLGDLLIAWSDDLFEAGIATAPPLRAVAARQLYGTMRREVTIGQFLDVAEESAFASAPDDRHAERALRVASLKSARYSVQRPLAIGAALGGADDAQRQALDAFGLPLGLAFQLRDDVLGVFGDEAQTGKPAGDDLREGKRTVLIAFAREALAPGARRVVDELVGDPQLDAGQIASLRETIVDTGALARVEELIREYTRKAERALSGARLGNAAVNDLRELARAATVRVA